VVVHGENLEAATLGVHGYLLVLEAVLNKGRGRGGQCQDPDAASLG
jgi:hypothetical protein